MAGAVGGHDQSPRAGQDLAGTDAAGHRRGLAASITTQATDSSALVGSNKPYAAMMFFGGRREDFPHLWGDIPARPYLPMDTEGNLQSEAEEAILDLALSHLERAARL